MTLKPTELTMEEEPGYRPPRVRLFRAAVLSFLVHLLFIMLLAGSSEVASLMTAGFTDVSGFGGLIVAGYWIAGLASPLVEIGVLIWFRLRGQYLTCWGIVIGAAAAIMASIALNLVYEWLVGLIKL